MLTCYKLEEASDIVDQWLGETYQKLIICYTIGDIVGYMVTGLTIISEVVIGCAIGGDIGE